MNNKTINCMKFILYLFGTLTVALPVQAASFDCTKVSTNVEKMICSDAELSKLDDELAVSYMAALQNQAQAETIKQVQKQWMKERNGCADVSCVNAIYEKRIAQLKNSNDANTQNTSVANTPHKHSAESRLSAGWDYKQEGGGMGTEPYTIGSDDVMCNQVKDYMNRVAPDWKPYKKGSAYMENYCTSAVRLFPGFTEPPWKELDPRKHEELIAKLLRYKIEGAREYFGYARPAPNRKSDSYYHEEARHFIESGGRLQYWKTHLVDFTPDPKDFIDKSWPPGDQYVIQLRFAVDYSIDRHFQNLPCRLPDWKGAVFLVTEDFSGPNPQIFDGGGSGSLSNSALFIYGGKPVLLRDDGFEISIQKYRDRQNFLPACTLIFPYYKFEQRK